MASSLRCIDSSSTAFSDKDFELLSKSFTDEKFLEYLKEFANEISDPRNLDHYESEVKKFNKERGVDVNFIKSSPGIALRTERVDNDTTAYVNISVSEEIKKPSFKFKENEHANGFNWVIPHAVLNPRKEFDIGKQCRQWCQYNENSKLNFRCEKEQAKVKKEGIWIYEVVVNPICLQLVNQNATLCHHLIEVVCDNIYDKFKIKLKNVVTLGHGLYIGTPATSQIKSVTDPELFHETENSLDFLYGKSQENKSTSEHFSDANKQHNHSIQHSFSEMPIISDSTTARPMQSIPVTPKYKLKHVNHASLQDYSVLQKTKPQSLRPQDLVLEVVLPGVKSSSIIDVDSFGKEVKLKTTKEPFYNLELTLPYEVKDDSNSAKFDVSKSVLEIRFQVVQAKPPCSFLDSKTLSQSKFITPESDKSVIENFIEPKINDGSNSKDADDQSETLKAVNDSWNHAILPSLCINQSDNFLFVYISMENMNIKSARSMELEVLNSTTFTFQFSVSKMNCGMDNASLDFPTLYGGKISVFPNSFKEKGVTYHFLEDKLLIQIEKTFPKLWEGLTVNSKLTKIEEANRNEMEQQCISFDSVTTNMSLSENNAYRTLHENGFQSEETAVSSVNDQCKEVSLEACSFPNCEYSQSTEFFFINFKHKKGSFSDIVLYPVNFKNIRFEYKHIESEDEGDTPRMYGGFVSISPHTYKSEELSHQIIGDALLIKVAKKKPALWRKVRAGLQPQQLKEVKLKSPKNSHKEQELSVQAFLVSEDDEIGPESGEERASITDQENNPLKSSEVAIPSGGRATNGCFVTGSWPRGILKSRSRSLSDSTIDGHFDTQCDLFSSNFNNVFGSSLECEDEALMHEEDEEDDEGDEEPLVGSPSKKSVRFNDFVCKQVFRSNSSIVGQKVKNLKKSQQKKRARERKLSEGSQSSETEVTTEPSDFATTTEDDSNAESERKENLPSARSEKIGRKKREKSNKKNKKKKAGLNLSTEITEMVFQLDDD